MSDLPLASAKICRVCVCVCDRVWVYVCVHVCVNFSKELATNFTIEKKYIVDFCKYIESAKGETSAERLEQWFFQKWVMRYFSTTGIRHCVWYQRRQSNTFPCDMHCNLLQHTATHCNTLQHAATHCNTLQHAATHCNTLQHTATHCNTLQHAATHPCDMHCPVKFIQVAPLKRWDTQHAATHCNTLQHIATHCNTLQRTATHCNTLRHTATHCDILQHAERSSSECLLFNATSVDSLLNTQSRCCVCVYVCVFVWVTPVASKWQFPRVGI